MQAGSKIRFVDAKGGEHTANVTEVTGTGKSLYKVVSLVHGDGSHVQDVPHESDADADRDGNPKGPYWHEVGAARRQVMVPVVPVPGGGVPSGAPDLILPPPEAVEAPKSGKTR